MESLENHILKYLSKSPSKVTFRCLKKRFSNPENGSVKKAVDHLVLSGRVNYTYEFGNSYLALSVDRPILVSKRVILTPPNTDSEAMPGQVVVVLERGGVFGLGDHPTTRLAIQLLDELLLIITSQNANTFLSAVDIGTGSGVLAIAAAKLGINSVIAIDTDPCAVFEARTNVRRNGLDNQILVRQAGRTIQNNRFNLVLANLRTPTLLKLGSQVENAAAPDCGLVFSGIQLEEAGKVQKTYEDLGFAALEMRSEKNWCAISLARGDIKTATV